jgi:hypothetical protein
LWLVALLALVVVPASAPAAPARQDAARPWAGSMTWTETNPGREQGDALLGVAGNGTFAAKLTGRQLAVVRLVGKLRGVPLDALAKGGTYRARFDVDAQNDSTGLVVATFKTPGIGSLCLGFAVDHGAYAGQGFLPAKGTVRTIGGTGRAATFRLGGRFDQKDLKDDALLTFLGAGSVDATVGPAKAPSAACKALAKS